jgi:hypothetical protein
MIPQNLVRDENGKVPVLILIRISPVSIFLKDINAQEWRLLPKGLQSIHNKGVPKKAYKLEIFPSYSIVRFLEIMPIGKDFGTFEIKVKFNNYETRYKLKLDRINFVTRIEHYPARAVSLVCVDDGLKRIVGTAFVGTNLEATFKGDGMGGTKFKVFNENGEEMGHTVYSEYSANSANSEYNKK